MSNLEKHIENLKKYINEDFTFREPIKNMGDFDKYCYGHCKDIETLLTAYEKEKEKNKELESDIQQKNFEIKCLNSDIKNMYCEEGVIAILEDNFDLSREEAIQILEEE